MNQDFNPKNPLSWILMPIGITFAILMGALEVLIGIGLFLFNPPKIPILYGFSAGIATWLIVFQGSRHFVGKGYPLSMEIGTPIIIALAMCVAATIQQKNLKA